MWNCGGQFKCLRITFDISFLWGITSSNSRRVRSAFHLREPNSVSVMWSTQHFGMWLLKPKDKVHILRDLFPWWSGCLFNKKWEICRLDAMLIYPASFFFFFWKLPHPIFYEVRVERPFFPIWPPPLAIVGGPRAGPSSKPSTERGRDTKADSLLGNTRLLYLPALAQGLLGGFTELCLDCMAVQDAFTQPSLPLAFTWGQACIAFWWFVQASPILFYFLSYRHFS